MTTPLEPAQANKRDAGTPADIVAQAEGPGGAAALIAAQHIVPAHLLDGGELVLLAIKPSAWYIILTSGKWIMIGLALAILANTQLVPYASKWYLWQLGLWLAALRMGWATLEWVSRLYVLTNRRVMRIRGVVNVELFECALERIQNTYLTLSIGERATRTGTIIFQTAGGPGAEASWRIIARPLEVHEKLREAIHRATRRNGNGL